MIIIEIGAIIIAIIAKVKPTFIMIATIIRGTIIIILKEMTRQKIIVKRMGSKRLVQLIGAVELGKVR